MKAFLNWSGGKDSALCIYKARQEGINIEALVTTINSGTNRISMHGVQKALLEQQAAALQLPLYIVELPEMPGMQEYEQVIHQTNQLLKAKGFTHAVSGDLFLEDLKAYREQLYAKDGISCLFPLWKSDTQAVIQSFLSLGFKAIIVCVNNTALDKGFCGRLLDAAFIHDLPLAWMCAERTASIILLFLMARFFLHLLHFKKEPLFLKNMLRPFLNRHRMTTMPNSPHRNQLPDFISAICCCLKPLILKKHCNGIERKRHPYCILYTVCHY